MKTLLTFLTILIMMGCSFTPNWVTQPSSPEWLNKDAFKGKIESLYGVGSVQGLHNIPLSWEVSENRARAQLARILRSKMKYAMSEDTDVSFKRKSNDVIRQNLEREVKTTTDILLRGGRVVERYYDEPTDTFWSLVKVPAKYLHSETLLNNSNALSKLETNKSLEEEDDMNESRVAAVAVEEPADIEAEAETEKVNASADPEGEGLLGMLEGILAYGSDGCDESDDFYDEAACGETEMELASSIKDVF